MHWFLKLFLSIKVVDDVYINLKVLENNSSPGYWIGAI